MRIEFTHPNYLWLLFIIPLWIFLHLYTLKSDKIRGLKFSNFEIIEKITRYVTRSYLGLFQYKYIILILRILVFTFLIFAISGTKLWYRTKSSNFCFVLAIDASSSMLADDYYPNRLEAAKKAAKIFIDTIPKKVKGSIVSFSGTSFVEQSPTDNKEKLKRAISNIQIKTVSGTDIGGAIITSANLLLPEDKSKIIILLTDGRDNVGVEPLKASKYAKQHDVIVYTIGIGTKKGGKFKGNVTSTLDDRTLRTIAKKTNGKYQEAKDETTLENIYKNIAEKEEIEFFINLTFPLLLLALIIQSIEWALLNTRYRIIP